MQPTHRDLLPEVSSRNILIHNVMFDVGSHPLMSITGTEALMIHKCTIGNKTSKQEHLPSVIICLFNLFHVNYWRFLCLIGSISSK